MADRTPDAPPDVALAPDDIVGAGLCIGCGACAVGREPLAWTQNGELKPSGRWTGQPAAAFARACPFSPAAANEDVIAARRFPDAPKGDARVGRHESAWVGHVAETEFRMDGSSGGMVSWVAAELLRRGEIDALVHVAPADGRFFGYRVSRSLDEVRAGARSRYYPVEMSQVLGEIVRTPGRYAIVGVPCFVKAVHLARAQDRTLAERISFTLGLFCGHMKSAALVESFAWQLDTTIDAVRAVEYRRKDPGRPANWYTAQLDLRDGSTRRQDWWHLADGDWGAGFFQNSACNWCDDVVAETADISFGDAWVEPYSSDGRGTNVVVARAPLLDRLLREAVADGRLSLREVDADFVAGTQAAGLRQRREGLAWRLRVMPPRLPVAKRVAPGGRHLPWRRQAIYFMRAGISRWSHRIFRLARLLRQPLLYLGWARTMLRLYGALAYRRGPLGRLLARLESRRPAADG